MTNRWTEPEIETLRLVYGRKMAKDCSSELPGRSASAIMWKAREVGIPSNRNITRKRYAVNRTFFDVPNVENSYWAGFIAADGDIAHNKPRVRIKLKDIDTDHLEVFRLACGSDVPVRNSFNGPRRYRLLDFNGVYEWKEALRRQFQITPRKSLTLQPPLALSSKCRAAFIAGYIDGDGCVFVERPRGTGLARLGLQVTGTHEMLSWIKEWCDAISPSRNIVRRMHAVYSYKVVGWRAEVIADVLLALQIPRLARKWNKVFECAEERAAS